MEGNYICLKMSGIETRRNNVLLTCSKQVSTLI